MAKPPRIFDEELGKRDDDHKLRIKPNRKMAWYNPQGSLRRLRRKRMAIGVIALLCLYFFVKFLPERVDRKSTRPIYTHTSPESNESKGRPPPRMGDVTEVVGVRPTKGAEKKPASGREGQTSATISISKDDQYWYDGPIKFAALRNSLMAASSLGGSRWINQNVMFAASNLKSAATLLPMACEMARQEKNDVHFAIAGREQMSIADIRDINGVDESCSVFMHDARPDRSFERTTESMELSVFAAMGHLRNYIHPQAVIIDNAELETKFFVHNTRVQARNLDFTLIELPKPRDSSLRWLTRLDASSLNAYNRVSINILIHAQPSGSGSILRLLHSLARADYFGSTPPHISIELPHDVDEELSNHLQNFKWPPSSSPSDSRLTLQKRIPSKSLSQDESAIRFLEGFYPNDARNSHVLVLSPQVELSPLYYHYLKYMVLEYKYSAATRMPGSKEAKMRDKLLGISLSLPSTYLNDTTAFVPPQHTVVTDGETTGPSFLWAAPNSEAALVFGDKWTELHNFVSHSLSVGPEQRPAKRISTTYPSWLEHLLTFSLTRGSSMVYPQLSSGSSLATVHSELYTPPEEFSVAKVDVDGAAIAEEFTANPSAHLPLEHSEAPVAHGSLLDILDNGNAMDMKDMPVLSYKGRNLLGARSELVSEAESFSEMFRTEVGMCKEEVPQGVRLVDLSVSYLFCQDEELEIEAPVDLKSLSTPRPKATIVEFEAAVDPKQTSAALPRKSQVGATKTEEEEMKADKAAVLSSAFAIPTSDAAADTDAKSLELEQLGGKPAVGGAGAGDEEGALPGGTRYATTSEEAHKEMAQVESAEKAGTEEPQEAGIETTSFKDVAAESVTSAADEVPAAEVQAVNGNTAVATEDEVKEAAAKEEEHSHEP